MKTLERRLMRLESLKPDPTDVRQLLDDELSARLLELGYRALAHRDVENPKLVEIAEREIPRIEAEWRKAAARRADPTCAAQQAESGRAWQRRAMSDVAYVPALGTNEGDGSDKHAYAEIMKRRAAIRARPFIQCLLAKFEKERTNDARTNGRAR
jgi:hypothetical protein